MSANLLKLCDPSAYYSQFLLESIYPDGRSIGRFRPVFLQTRITSLAAGSCLVRQGGVSVTCKVEPLLAAVSDAPVIVPCIQVASTIPRTVVDDAIVTINQLIMQNALFTRDMLKTSNERLMWILNLHITILSVDGAVCDALTTCVTGALFDLKLPDANTDCSEDIPVDIRSVKLSDDSHRIPLADIPVSSTFIIYELPGMKARILCDPTIDLFKYVKNSVTVVVGSNECIHRIVQIGICGDDETLRKVVELAIGRQKVIADSMVQACKAIDGSLSDLVSRYQ